MTPIPGLLHLSVSENKLAQTCLTPVCRTKQQGDITLSIHPELSEIGLLLLFTSLELPHSLGCLSVTSSVELAFGHLLAVIYCRCWACPDPCPEELHCNKLYFNACQPAVLLAITWQFLPCDLMRMFPKRL